MSAGRSHGTGITNAAKACSTPGTKTLSARRTDMLLSAGTSHGKGITNAAKARSTPGTKTYTKCVAWFSSFRSAHLYFRTETILVFWLARIAIPLFIMALCPIYPWIHPSRCVYQCASVRACSGHSQLHLVCQLSATFNSVIQPRPVQHIQILLTLFNTMSCHVIHHVIHTASSHHIQSLQLAMVHIMCNRSDCVTRTSSTILCIVLL